VPRDSTIESPEQLAGVPISVGYQSGSLRNDSGPGTVHAQLSFSEGMLFNRVDLLIAGKLPAATLF
jgi:hypothetical protein